MRARVLLSAVTLAVVTAVGSTGLAACSGGGQHAAGHAGSASSDDAPAVVLPPTLPSAWTSDSGIGEALFTTSEPVVSGDLVVTEGSDGLSGWSLATGDREWTVHPPRGLTGVCATSPQVSPSGYLGVLFTGKGHPCTTAGAVDVRKGRLAWTHETRRVDHYDTGRSVSVSAHTLDAIVFCDEVDEFRLRDGRPTGVISHRDRKCADKAASDGPLLSVLNDPVTPETPSGHGTGFIPAVDEPGGSFDLYDADTGRRVWRRPLATTRGADTTQILSEKPLVITYTEHDQTVARIVDAHGRPGPYLGKTLDSIHGLTTVLGEGDGVLVLQYPDAADPQLAYGYDVHTGRELWHLGLTATSQGGTTIGTAEVEDGRLVVATPVQEPSARLSDDSYAPPATATWLTSHDLREPTQRVQTLGRVPGSLLLLHGDRVITSSSAGAVHSALFPSQGPARTYAEPTPAQLGTLATHWTHDDLLPGATVLACEAVTPHTLSLLGIRRGALPPPSDCSWYDGSHPEFVDRTLRVSVTTESPRDDLGYEDDDASPTGSPSGSPTDSPATSTLDPAARAAHAVAMRVVDQLRQDEYQVPQGPSSRTGTLETKLPGLGDEAWVTTPYDDGDAGETIQVVARYRNVVVEVEATLDAINFTDTSATPRPDQVDAAALSAAGDVLRRLGAPATRPPTPTSTSTSPSLARAVATCRAGRADAATLAPGARADDQTQPGQHLESACEWDSTHAFERPGATLDVSSYAVPASALGTAAQNAVRFAHLLGGGRRTAVHGLPRTTWARDYADNQGGAYRDAVLTTVRDNLVVVVDYTVSNRPSDKATLDVAVTRLARHLLAAGPRK